MSGGTSATTRAVPSGRGGDGLLRLAVRLDAVATGTVGVLALAAAPALAGPTGLPAGTLREVGGFLIVYAAAIGAVGARRVINRPAVWGAAGINFLWVVASIALVARGPFALTVPGAALVLAQAAAVAVFADLQLLGLRRAGAD